MTDEAAAPVTANFTGTITNGTISGTITLPASALIEAGCTYSGAIAPNLTGWKSVTGSFAPAA